MDAGVQAVALILGMMLAMLALAGLGLLVRHLWSGAQARRAEERGQTDPALWWEEVAATGDLEERRCLERWQTLLDARGAPGATGFFTAAPSSARSPAPRRRALIAALLAAALPGGYLLWSALTPPQALDDPEEVLALVAIDKWADAVSMFQDKLRVRFQYRNLGVRRVDAFSVYFELADKDGQVVLRDMISICNPVSPGKTATWTQSYWSSCQQILSPQAYAALLQGDLDAYRIEWRPVGLVYDDGEGRTTLGPMPGDSLLEFEP